MVSNVDLHPYVEVEAALHSHPAVEQAAVFGVDNAILGKWGVQA